MSKRNHVTKWIASAGTALLLSTAVFATNMLARHSQSSPTAQKLRQGSLVQVDTHKPWSTPWVTGGIPHRLLITGRAGNWRPWIVADPSHVHRTWWLWPLAIRGHLYFAQGYGSLIHWHSVPISSPKTPNLPRPWRTLLAWAHDFLQHKAPPAHVVLAPSRAAWYAQPRQSLSLTGLMMAMQSRPHTVALGILFAVPRGGWIQFVGVWQWNRRWIAHYLIINPQPPLLSKTNLLMPPNHGLPLPLPSWAQ